MHRKTLEETFFPIVVLINSIPVVAKAPILVLLLGNGMEPKIAIAALICFFPTLVNMVRGLESVNPQAMELMRVLSASKREMFFKLRLYNSLPYLFSALKIAASTAVVGAIVGEWIGSNYGIGALIIQATYAFDSALLYATVVVGSAFSVLFFLAISLAERLVVRWQPPRDRLMSRQAMSFKERIMTMQETHRRSRRRGARRRPLGRRRGRRRPGRLRRGDRGAARGLLGDAGRALSLSRRPRLRRHGAGARRHAQWRRDHRHRHLHGDDRAHGEARRCASIRRRRSAGRALGLYRKWARWGVFDFRAHVEAARRSSWRRPSIRTAGSASPTR